jgi:hypothetical protein
MLPSLEAPGLSAGTSSVHIGEPQRSELLLPPACYIDAETAPEYLRHGNVEAMRECLTRVSVVAADIGGGQLSVIRF